MQKLTKTIVSKYFLIIIFLLLLAVFFVSFNLKSKNISPVPSATEKQLQIETGSKIVTINVEIAKTEAELTQGLSNRAGIDQNSGMYFELGQRAVTSFWMKEMLFPLDIIWIDNGTIIGIEKNAPIPTSATIPTFHSPTAVTNVLEVNGGFSDKNGIKTGDKVEIK